MSAVIALPQTSATTRTERPASEPTAKPAKADVATIPELQLPVWRQSHRGLHIDHIRSGSRKIRRYVVLESKAMRDALGMPRRTEIDPLCFTTKDGIELRTSSLHELAMRTAEQLLRELYDRVSKARVTLQRSKPVREPKRIGLVVEAEEHQGHAVGTLVYAGPRKDCPFCVELLDEGEVRRIKGVDLARAIEESAVQIGDVIRVVLFGQNQIQVTETRSGTHGDTAVKAQARREMFVISKEVRHESNSGDRHSRR